MPRQARYIVPRGLPRRGEFLAACLVLLVVAHVLFAQLTIVVAVALVLVTRVTRWRLSWLAVPAVIGLAWTAAVGPRAAAAGLADGPARVLRYLGASGHQAVHLLHFTAAFTGIGGWLPRQLPLAILTGTAEAAIIGWLSWLHTDERSVLPARPGLLAAARRAAVRRAIRLGGVVTRDGGCLGIAEGSGARVAVSWPETAGGIAVCGSSGPDVLTAGFQLVHAAIRRRKPVLVVDLTADRGLPARLAAICAAAGAPLQVFGPGPACYEPFRQGDPARRAALVMDMVSWDGPGSQYRRSCLAYLQDVFELIDAAPGDPRVPVLDEVIHLLNPTAMKARMEHVPAGHPRREALAERTRVSVTLLHAEPATTAQLSRQLRELRGSAFGRWLRPAGPDSTGPDSTGRDPAMEIDLRRAVTQRGVVLFRLGAAGAAADAASSAMLIRLVGQDLLAAGAALHRIGVDGDGIVWLTECGLMPRDSVTDLITQGRGAGLPVLAATTSGPAAAQLAELTNVVVMHRMADAAAARQLAAVAGGVEPLLPPETMNGTAGPGSGPDGPAGLAAFRDGEFLLAVKQPRRVVPRARLVRTRIPGPRARGGPW
ncbi:MAG: hypothetical protein ACRDOB_04345 [Streptosporangiaceae bacterium]